jgi:hypothetical protein
MGDQPLDRSVSSVFSPLKANRIAVLDFGQNILLCAARLGDKRTGASGGVVRAAAIPRRVESRGRRSGRDAAERIEALLADRRLCSISASRRRTGRSCRPGFGRDVEIEAVIRQIGMAPGRRRRCRSSGGQDRSKVGKPPPPVISATPRVRPRKIGSGPEPAHARMTRAFQRGPADAVSYSGSRSARTPPTGCRRPSSGSVVC